MKKTTTILAGLSPLAASAKNIGLLAIPATLAYAGFKEEIIPRGMIAAATMGGAVFFFIYTKQKGYNNFFSRVLLGMILGVFAVPFFAKKSDMTEYEEICFIGFVCGMCIDLVVKAITSFAEKFFNQNIIQKTEEDNGDNGDNPK